QGLFEDFLRRRDVEIRRFPRVQCSNCSYAQERATIVRRLNQGRTYVGCEECGQRIELPPATALAPLSSTARQMVDNERMTVRRRVSYETVLVRIKALVRDRQLSRPSCFISYAWGQDADAEWVKRLAGDLADAGIDVILDVWENADIGSSIPRFVERI